MPDPLAIDLRQVSKVYGGKVAALRGVDLRVAPGEVFGLLGPNGAGKSTLVKIVMTVVRPTRRFLPTGAPGTAMHCSSAPWARRRPSCW